MSAAGQFPPPPQVGELFLLGKVPMPWLYAAAQLPGRTVEIGIEIWHRAFLTKSRLVPISISATAQRMGFDRATGLRALRALHEGGLITRLDTAAGRKSLVRLEWPAVRGPREV